MACDLALSLPFFSINREDTPTEEFLKVIEESWSLDKIAERCLQDIFHRLCRGYDLIYLKRKKQNL